MGGYRMQQTIKLEAQVLGQRHGGLRAREVELRDLATPLTLDGLIRGVVIAEIAAFHTRSMEREFVRLLTEPELREEASTGKVRTGPGFDDAPTDVDENEAVEAALLAFTDGLFMVVVDEHEMTDLGQEVTLQELSSVLFIRLVALAGG